MTPFRYHFEILLILCWSFSHGTRSSFRITTLLNHLLFSFSSSCYSSCFSFSSSSKSFLCPCRSYFSSSSSFAIIPPPVFLPLSSALLPPPFSRTQLPHSFALTHPNTPSKSSILPSISLQRISPTIYLPRLHDP